MGENENVPAKVCVFWNTTDMVESMMCGKTQISCLMRAWVLFFFSSKATMSENILQID